jgi:hypothetical protein
LKVLHSLEIENDVTIAGRIRRYRGRRFMRFGAIVLVVAATMVVNGQRLGERDRRESTAIGRLRAVTSGESAFAASYGYYDTLACLASSTPCALDLQAQNPFLARDFWSAPEFGYQLAFFDGPHFQSTTRRASTSAMIGYAVTAVPVMNASPYRAFCVDERKTIYVSRQGAPRVENGHCVDTAGTLK